MSAVRMESKGNYTVIGASGAAVGFIQKLQPRGWLLSLHAQPNEQFEYLRDAKNDALQQAEDYR